MLFIMACLIAHYGEERPSKSIQHYFASAENKAVAGEQLTLDVLKMQIHSVLTDIIS